MLARPEPPSDAAYVTVNVFELEANGELALEVGAVVSMVKVACDTPWFSAPSVTLTSST